MESAAGSEQFAIGTGRTVILSCDRGHSWESVETHARRITERILSLTTEYRPGACTTCDRGAQFIDRTNHLTTSPAGTF